MRKVLSLAAFAAGLLVLAGQPVAAGVDVGDVAPPLRIKEWVHGKPVDLAKDAARRLHLVEFWATWCPPCKASVPLLTEYQKKFEKDLVIIGVTDPDPYRNSPSDIKQFVKQQGAAMAYTVAMDDKGQTLESYMDTSQGVAIPQAFLVGKDGRIVWQGSPLDPAMERVIQQVIDGKYDVAAAKQAAATTQELDKRFRALQMAFEMEQMDVVWDGLIDIFRIDPANEMAIRLLVEINANEDGYSDKFNAWARSYLEQNRANPAAMGVLSAALLTVEDIAARSPELAVEAARAAYESSNRSDPLWIENYARAMHQIGAVEKAIALQEEAVVKVSDAEREAARKVLDYYKTCKRLQTTVQ